MLDETDNTTLNSGGNSTRGVNGTDKGVGVSVGMDAAVLWG